MPERRIPDAIEEIFRAGLFGVVNRINGLENCFSRRQIFGRWEFIPMESQSSSDLLREFLADPKNRELFGNFYKKYHPRMKQCCLRLGLGDADSEDLTAILLLRFVEKDVFDRFVFQTKAQFNSWLATVVRNEVLTFLRMHNRRREQPQSQEALEQIAEEMVRDLNSAHEKDFSHIKKGLSRIKDRVGAQTFQLFELLVFGEKTVEEVMVHFGLSKNAVYAAKSRVMRMLREELKDLFDPTNDEKESLP